MGASWHTHGARAQLTTALDLALSYARAGYDVLPLHGIVEPASADVVERFRAGELTKKEAQAHARCTCGAQPCSSPGKHPRVSSMDAATRDENKIAMFFRNPAVPTNVGIRLPPGQFALDFDLYVPGVPELLDSMRIRRLPDTLTQESGSGGIHLIYAADPQPFGSKFGGANGIDLIHHDHRYLVAAPSFHWTGSRYRWVSDSEPARALDWIIEQAKPGARGYAAKRERSKERASGDGRGLLCPPDVEPGDWAVTLASEILPPAIEDGHPDSVEHGHATLAKAACHLVAGCELSEVEALEVLWEHYNPRCIPPWDDGEYEDFERCVMTAGAHATPGYLVPSEQTRAMFERAKERHANREKAKPAGVARRERREAARSDDGESPWGQLPITLFDPSLEPEPLDYVWGPFAPGKVSAVIGYAENSKTPWALQYSLCVAAGEPFLGLPTRPLKTLHVVFEGARNARRKALRIARALGGTLETVREEFAIATMPSASLTPDAAAELVERAHAQGFEHIVLDTYGSALDSNIDRNAAAFSDALKAMGDLSDELGLLVVVLLHLNKTVKPGMPLLPAIDGHNSIAGALQAAMALTRPDHSDEFTFDLTCERAPDTKLPPIQITWRDVPEPNRTIGQRIAAAHAEGQADDSSKWGLIAEVVADSRASVDAAQAAAYALDVEVLAWFEAHRPNGHAADTREVVEGLGKKTHPDTNKRLRESLVRLVERGKLGADRPPTERGSRFGLLGKQYSHAQGLVELAGEIAGGYDVSEGAARMRAERALRD